MDPLDKPMDNPVDKPVDNPMDKPVDPMDKPMDKCYCTFEMQRYKNIVKLNSFYVFLCNA